MISFESELTKQSYIKLGLLLNFGHPVMYIFLPLIWIIGALIFLDGAFLIGALMVGFPVFLFLILFVQLIFITRAPTNSKLFERIQFTFDDAAVKMKAEYGESESSWDLFVRWRKIGEHYMLYPSNRTFFAIPEAAIPSADRATFESLLKSKIGKEKTANVSN